MLCFSILTLVLAEFSSFATCNLSSYAHMRTYKEFNVSPDETVSNITSEMGCIVTCLEVTNCVAITYKYMECSIIHHKILTFDANKGGGTVVMVRPAPGVHVIRNNKQYDYTYAEANAVCQSVGRLMTHAEIVTMYNNGYELCSCGWTSGPGRYYPMQTQVPNCGNVIGVMDCSWAPKANAWCFLD